MAESTRMKWLLKGLSRRWKIITSSIIISGGAFFLYHYHYKLGIMRDDTGAVTYIETKEKDSCKAVLEGIEDAAAGVGVGGSAQLRCE